MKGRFVGIAVLALLTVGLLPSTALTQSGSRKSSSPNRLGRPVTLRPKIDDEIEFQFLGKLQRGVVLDVNRKQLRVAFEFAGQPKQRTIDMSDARYPWQADALSPVYVWKDASGEFSIRAAMMEVDDAGRRVTLYDVDKNREVVLDVAKLGEKEAERVRVLGERGQEIRKRIAAPLNFPPPSSKTSSWVEAEDLAALSADPPAVVLAVPSGGASTPALDVWDGILGVYPIGSSAGWIAGLTGADASFAKDRFPGRLVWATLRDGKVRRIHRLPNGEKLVAVHPRSSQVLTMGEAEPTGSRSTRKTLTVWSSNPKFEEAEHRVRWFSQKEFSSLSTEFAEFIDAGHVMHQWERSRYVIWNVIDRRGVYEIEQESFFGAAPVLSPGRRYFAIPEDKRVRVIEAATGTTLAALPIDGGRTSGVAFDQAGERLAVLTQNQLAIWNLGSPGGPRTHRADLIGSPFAKTLAWVGNDRLLVGGEVLFDLERELPIWNYRRKVGEVARDDGGGNLTSIVGSRLCYGVDNGMGKNRSLVIGAVELPGPMVEDVLPRIDLDALYVADRGTPMAVQIDCGSDSARVRTEVDRIMRDNDWALDSSAAFVIVAIMGRLPTQTVTYQPLSGFGQKQTVSVTPYFSRLEIKRDDRVVWSDSSSSGGLSPIVWLGKGETLEGNARQGERPDPGFFERVKPPAKLFNQRFKKGFGTSTYGVRGLSPQPLDDLPLLTTN